MKSSKSPHKARHKFHKADAKAVESDVKTFHITMIKQHERIEESELVMAQHKLSDSDMER